ncbi:alpha/beta fold hydrolase [Pinibacter aurantiacus]|uniref:Alpha/beta hydrolase n=1 Tax=Pinibacter aurantiacus TaxID=2851599 RepID=A0A9E2S8C4_9BACT|nr:alpha/beta hydrolase [Pinibacter aurantiacus]MBV4358161.1 alpha/beta hydrolase [Pinibacter aurantiacus]
MKTLSLNNKKLVYAVSGSGAPVVLLHGFAEDHEVWENQVATLQNNYTVIVPDLPGSGASDRLDETSMESMADAVKSILENEKIDQAVVIGHSMGGYVALAFGEKYPQFLKGLGLFHSTAFPDTEEKKETRRKGIEFIKKNGAYLFIKQTTPNLFTENYKLKNSDKVVTFIEHLKEFEPESLIAYYYAMIARPDRTLVLKNFSKPVLLIIGKNDVAVPYKDSLALSHLSSTTYVTILEHSAHMGMMEETDKSNEALESYLQEVIK